MSTHVSVDRSADGRPVACKRAMTPDAVDRIRDEARRLTALDHPGVVRFVELREGDDGPVLVTEYVGPRTMATAGIVPADRAARLVADLATTLADLHAQGVVHGAVRAEHVLLAGDRTVLCGFAPGGDHAPEDDVAGAGEALRHLLDPELEEEPIPDRRPWRRLAWVGYRHRALLTLADQATVDEPARRPSARALAHALREVAGDPAPPVVAPSGTGREGPGWRTAVADLVAVRFGSLRRRTRDPAPGGRRPRRSVLALGAAGVVLAGLGAGGLAGGVRATSTSAPPLPAPAGPRLHGCPPAAGPLSADLDGDGCPESVRAGPGWLEVEGRRYRVGRAGDDLAVGDWDGDGLATVALLRTSTGDLWSFPRWDPDRAITATVITSVPEATALRRRAVEDGHELVVVGPGGSTTVVAEP